MKHEKNLKNTGPDSVMHSEFSLVPITVEQPLFAFFITSLFNIYIYNIFVYLVGGLEHVCIFL